MKPPDVVDVAAECDETAQLHRIEQRAAAVPAADIPDRHPIVPRRDEEQPVTNEDVVYVRSAHLLRPDRGWIRRIREIDDEKLHGRGIDAQERVQLAVDARQCRRVHAG